MRDRRGGHVHLPDRGSRRQRNRDAKGNRKCHKDEFRAHDVASHFHLHPARIWVAGAAIQIRGGTRPTNRIAIPGELFPPPTRLVPAKSFGPSFQLENASLKWKTPHSTLTVHEPDPRAVVHCGEPIQKFCEFDWNRCHTTELFRSCQMAPGFDSDGRYLIA